MVIAERPTVAPYIPEKETVELTELTPNMIFASTVIREVSDSVTPDMWAFSSFGQRLYGILNTYSLFQEVLKLKTGNNGNQERTEKLKELEEQIEERILDLNLEIMEEKTPYVDSKFRISRGYLPLLNTSLNRVCNQRSRDIYQLFGSEQTEKD